MALLPRVRAAALLLAALLLRPALGEGRVCTDAGGNPIPCGKEDTGGKQKNHAGGGDGADDPSDEPSSSIMDQVKKSAECVGEACRKAVQAVRPSKDDRGPSFFQFPKSRPKTEPTSIGKIGQAIIASANDATELAGKVEEEKQLAQTQPEKVPEKAREFTDGYEAFQRQLQTLEKPISSVLQGSLTPLEPAKEAAVPLQAKKAYLSVSDTYSDAYYRQDPQDPEANRVRGLSLVQQERYPEAEKRLRFALENGKMDTPTLTAYGGAAYGMKDFKTAALSARLALQLDSTDRRAGALLKLSEGRVSQVRLPPIGEAFQGAERGEDLRAVPFGKGERLPSEDGAPMRAESAREIARREVGRGLPGAQERSAELARVAGSKLAVRDFAGSKEAASRALEEDPRNTQAYALRAMANNRLGLYEEARKDADAALRRSPRDTPSLLSRSLAFNRLKKHSPALDDSESVLERERRNVFAHLMKAYAHEGLHARAPMVASLRTAASLSAAYEPLYQKALQVPASQDALFLFERDLLPGPAPAAPGRARWPLFLLAGAAAAALACLAYLAGAASTREVQIPPPAAEGVQGIGSRYEVLGKIGSGGMGEVFEGRDLALDRRVAIKKLRGDSALDPSEREVLLSEARTVAKLKHPGIVEIYAVLEEEGDAYLVFEFVEGKTLSELLRERGPIPVETARTWLRGACEAIEHAHSQGVVHRDIKPSNIMVAGERVKVMDFGLSRPVQDAPSRVGAPTAAGTPAYMAPEQERGSVRKESDVFALGVCFYELLTGELPFEGVGAGMLVNKLAEKYIPLSRRLGAVSPGLEEAVAKALAADPDRRTRSPSEFSAALDALKLL